MNYARLITTFFLLILLITLVGCKSRQNQSGTGAATPQEKTGANAASPQDMADAKAAAMHVLAQFEAGEFPQIYKESAPGFKQAGNETDFVAQFQQTRQKSGVLKNPKESSYEGRPDKTYVLTYRVENERFVSDINLTFVRSTDGKMELAGLHEHDEPKKK
jgi:hypothetical protein